MLVVQRWVRETLLSTRRATDVGDEPLMTTHLRSILVPLSLFAAISAQADSSPPRRTLPRNMSPIMAVLDSDHDGRLSAREIEAAPMVLKALDLNQDGLISPEERRAFTADGRPARAWRGATAFNVVLTLDANHDDDIQSMEIANAVSSLKRLDRNGDGQLTPDELRPVMVAPTRA